MHTAQSLELSSYNLPVIFLDHWWNLGEVILNIYSKKTYMIYFLYLATDLQENSSNITNAWQLNLNMKTAWLHYKSLEIKYKLWLLIQPVGGKK